MYEQSQVHNSHCDVILLPKAAVNDKSTVPLWSQSSLLAAVFGEEFLNNVQIAHNVRSQEKKNILLVEPGFRFVHNYLYHGEFFHNVVCGKTVARSLLYGRPKRLNFNTGMFLKTYYLFTQRA